MSKIRRILTRIDSHTLWAFNPQHHLDPQRHLTRH